MYVIFYAIRNVDKKGEELIINKVMLIFMSKGYKHNLIYVSTT